MTKRPWRRFGLRSDHRRRAERRLNHDPTESPARHRVTHPIIRFATSGNLATPPAGTSIAEALRFPEAGADRMTMIFYPQPDRSQIEELGTAWGLHPVLFEDILIANQRPKIERYGDVLFLVVRSAHYEDAIEEVRFAEFHILARPGAVAVLCQDGEWVDGMDSTQLDEEHPFTTMREDNGLLAGVNLLTLGVEAVVYRVIDAIVDHYEPVLRGLEIDKEEVERQVFSGDAAVAERIYHLSQEIIEIQQTVSSMTEVVDALKAGFEKYLIPDELQKYLDDVSDHLAKAASHTRDLRDSLSQILNVNATLVAQRQNEDMKKISAWAAILFTPSLVGAVYGMNFDVMPELHWAFGYPMSLVMMVVLAVALYIAFKKSNWM